MNEKNNEASVHLFTCSVFSYTKDILQAPGGGGRLYDYAISNLSYFR